jgi:hypothetical protein
MKYTCPKCGHVGDTLKEKDAPIQAANAMYARFSFSEKLVREYIGLFASPAGFLSTPKETRLVEELLDIWESENFGRGGRQWRTTRDEIAVAVQLICNSQKPMRTHNYLLVILKAKAVEAEKAAEQRKDKKAFSNPRAADPKPVVWPPWCVKDVEKCQNYYLGLLTKDCQDKCKWKN